jgi:hypothetical protein
MEVPDPMRVYVRRDSDDPSPTKSKSESGLPYRLLELTPRSEILDPSKTKSRTEHDVRDLTFPIREALDPKRLNVLNDIVDPRLE